MVAHTLSCLEERPSIAGASIGDLLRRICQALRDGMEHALSVEGATYVQWRVLAYMRHDDVSTAAGLARGLRYDAGAMTRVLDGLEKRCFVYRDRRVDDRRVVSLSLTDAGVGVADRGSAAIRSLWSAWLADWTPAEVTSLERGLERLVNAMADAASC